MSASSFLDINLLEDVFQKHRGDSVTNNKPSGIIPKAEPTAKLFTNHPYANLGHSFHVADLNGDKKDDLLIGSPGKPFIHITIHTHTHTHY